MLAEAWLLQDDLDQAASALGRTLDTFRETIPSGRLSTLWRLHGRLASARGDQSRAIALHGRALKAADTAHDSRAIGLAHYELGQCYRQVGDIAIVREHISKAASALHAAGDRRHRALDVRSPIQFHETTGAVFDTLAQIHLIRGRYEPASDFLGRASEAYGAYGRQTSHWYEWSVRVLGARLALRRGLLDEAVSKADEILQAGAPPFDALQATLIATEALTSANRLAEAEKRLASAADALDPKVAPAAWGEYLRLRGALHAKNGSAADAYHDFAQSATLLDLLGERYQSALSHLALGRLVAETGARSIAERHLNKAFGIFTQLGAERDLNDTRNGQALLTTVGTGQYLISPADADDAIV